MILVVFFTVIAMNILSIYLIVLYVKMCTEQMGEHQNKIFKELAKGLNKRLRQK